MQPTDLVHLAYLRMQEQGAHFPGGQAQFMALSATMMRRILVNHALAHQAQKRGAGETRLTLSVAALVEHPGAGAGLDMLELDRALQKLAEIDARMVTIIELRYLSGLSVDDTADAIGISPATVKREWNTARRWLARELGGAAMDTARWKRVKEVVGNAMELPAAERDRRHRRTAFAARRCGHQGRFARRGGAGRLDPAGVLHC